MRAFGQLWQFFSPFKARIGLSLLLGFLTVGAGIGLMATSGYLIASAALHPATILLLWVPIVGVRFFGMSRAVFRYLERYVSHDLTFRILSRLRVWLYERIEPTAPVSLQKSRQGDVLSTLTSDVDTLQNLYLRVFAPPVIAALTLLLVYAIVAHWDVVIAWMLITLLLLAGVGVPLLTLHIGKRDSKGTIQSRAMLYTSLTDSIHGMTELITFGQTEAVLEQLRAQQTELSKQQLRLSHVSGLSTGLTTFLQNFAAWVVLLFSIPLVNTHHLTGVSLTALVLTALASFEAVSPLATVFQSFGQGLEAARRVFHLAAQEPTAQQPEAAQVGILEPLPAQSGAQQPEPVESTHVKSTHVKSTHVKSTSVQSTSQRLPTSFDLSLQSVTFRYPNRETAAPHLERSLVNPPVLNRMSFDLPYGKHIAIVGHSGSGKSTLVDLLVRFWEYQGSIFLGGQELRNYSAQVIRDLITVVPQQPYLFHTSIAENLRVAKPDATFEELAEAVEAAELTQFISRLPEGLNTLVGEQGTTLSGGERQRIALARAFLQSAPIWVLDEATNGLDAVTEEAVLSNVQRHVANKSLILITHRLAGLEQMDEILVMRHGEIEQRGTHTELLASPGSYRTMWETATSTF